ncbi:MAG: EAL domain-containing protein [Proteobacteria bacterium]|nr:EAL domain-containing protein [Pseudomonadota bacterium]MBU1417878.1 EAL domain-containing protein [Pseudomonadota bacterium]MBU1453400.1 EAL domain-containing protein [Pseudomonadota bacterium]
MKVFSASMVEVGYQLKIVSISMVIIGVLLLALSLIPTQKICRRRNQLYKGWKWLAALIVFFILGYILYINILFKSIFITTQHLIVSSILLSGSIFVVMVVRLSLASIRRSEHLTDRERHRALHDELTELPNRILIEERLDHGLTVAKRRREPLAVLLMDLVRFKEINDSLGHFYGDYLLQEVAHRMQGVVRESDTLARFGGDEFAMVLPATTLSQAVMISQKIAAAVEEPFLLEGHNVNVGISIGIALYPEHGLNSETLILYADMAMYDAKRNDVIYAIFNPDQDRTTFNRLVMVGELREALLHKQMFLDYQPKVSIRKKGIIGVEALLRWQHPDKGIIGPDDFIPLAEQAGLIKSLTTLVLDKALEQCSLWEQAGLQIPVAVNLSIKNLHDLDFPKEVKKLLKKWQVVPHLLVLEITESCIIVDQERVASVVRELKSNGIKLSIDDFGTGYSSISYLKKFPAREIKIDKSFVIDMVHNEDNAVIVKSTIDMVHNIGGQVVAEGVEDEATQDLLTELGCDFLQGFHVCRPLSPNLITEWFQSTPWCNKG